MSHRALLSVTSPTGDSRLYITHSGEPERVLGLIAAWAQGRELGGGTGEGSARARLVGDLALDDITDKGWYVFDRVLADPREHDLETIYHLDVLNPATAHLAVLEHLSPDDTRWTETADVDFSATDTTPLRLRAAGYLGAAIARIQTQAPNPNDPDVAELLEKLRRDRERHLAEVHHQPPNPYAALYAEALSESGSIGSAPDIYGDPDWSYLEKYVDRMRSAPQPGGAPGGVRHGRPETETAVPASHHPTGGATESEAHPAVEESRDPRLLLAARWEVYLDVTDEAREAGWAAEVRLGARAWRAMFGHCSYPKLSAGPEELVPPERRGLVELLEAAHNAREDGHWEELWPGMALVEFTPPPIIALGSREFGPFHLVKAEGPHGPAAYRIDIP